MTYGAIDLHSVQSQVRIVTAASEILDRRIPTTRDQFSRLFPSDRPMRVLLEASTESEWVAQCLEAGGHDVIVADPNYAPMYGHRTRRIKTDRRDVAALAEACRLQIYRLAHRAAPPPWCRSSTGGLSASSRARGIVSVASRVGTISATPAGQPQRVPAQQRA